MASDPPTPARTFPVLARHQLRRDFPEEGDSSYAVFTSDGVGQEQMTICRHWVCGSESKLRQPLRCDMDWYGLIWISLNFHDFWCSRSHTSKPIIAVVLLNMSRIAIGFESPSSPLQRQGNTDKHQHFRVVLVFSTPTTGSFWVDWTSPSFQMLTDTTYTVTWCWCVVECRQWTPNPWYGRWWWKKGF